MPDDERLSPELVRAVEMLRDGPEPSGTWRADVQRALAQVPTPQRVRRWSARPWVAVAAGIACMVLGAAGFAALASRTGGGSALPLTSAMPAVTVRFQVDAPAASRVTIAGDFNAWSPVSLPMTRAADGRSWVIEVPLTPGRYAYSFVVDGALVLDPAAPRSPDDGFGTLSSVVLVRGS